MSATALAVKISQSQRQMMLLLVTEREKLVANRDIRSNGIKPQSLFAKTVDRQAQSRQQGEMMKHTSKEESASESDQGSFADIER